MDEYSISTLTGEQYSNSSNIQFVAFLINKSNPDVKLELTFNNIKTEEEVINIVKEFNNPLRMKNTYQYEEIEECERVRNNKLVIYCTTIRKYSFEIYVRCINKGYLCDFIRYINNPDDVDFDFLIKEHIRLTSIIDNHFNNIRELEKKRKLLEYRIWGSVFNKDVDAEVVEDDS